MRRRPAFNTADYRDNTIDGVKDLRRTLDYLETRADIDSKALAFFGYSWGGVNGPVALAHESRLRAAVIDIGLLPPMSATPEVDPVNALPRVHQPTLMFSGEFDSIVPVANAKRYFELDWHATSRQAPRHRHRRSLHSARAVDSRGAGLAGQAPGPAAALDPFLVCVFAV